jgi:tetratricopeptide (TPR) repeat protein
MDQLGALEQVRKLLDPAEDPRLWLDNTAYICNSLHWGPVPAAEAIERIEAANWGPEAQSAGRGGFAAPLLAMLGRFDEARAQQRQSVEYLKERGLTMRVGASALTGGSVEELAGDLEAADRTYEEGIAILDSLGETGVRSTMAAMRANILYRLGRPQEMEAAVRLAQETGAANDIATQVDWRGAAAKLAADEGRLADAKRLVGEAVELVEPTDFLELRGRAFEALAHVEARGGRPDRWKAALDQALAEHEQKGNLVAAGRVRDQQAAGPPESVPTN